MEWGRTGLERLAPLVDVVVIIDVLSFAGAVEVAVSRGAAVTPCPQDLAEASKLARQREAALAVARRRMDAEHPFSLSPRSLENLNPGDRLVLPSPNGGALSAIAAGLCRQVLCGCLRNADAVAARAQELGRRVAVIAAGELWPESTDEDGLTRSGATLRPAFEDLIGAGAVLNCFPEWSLSPEALAAVAAFRVAEASLESSMMNCVSGRELCDLGFKDDVLHASLLNCSRIVPRLVDGEYRRD